MCPPAITVAEAEVLQREVGAQVEIPAGPVPAPETVTGLDVSYDQGSNRITAAAVVVDVGSLQIVDQSIVTATVEFPYVVGLLAFREIPALLTAIEGLSAPPELLVCDGQGLAHPRRCGVACHLGVVTGLPAIGSAKNHLTGAYDEPGARRGDRSPLTEDGDVLGYALRTQDDVRSVFVSAGHRIGHEQAADLVLALSPFRVPEPVRHADHLSRQALTRLAPVVSAPAGPGSER